jgi:Fis family transcriptional regulator, factor for inversion stimulation protein
MKTRTRINGHGEVARCIEKSLDDYFRKLDGEPATDIYDMVICNVEKTLFETVMQHAKGNQTQAAEMLGVNRNTLRTKLKHYGIK